MFPSSSGSVGCAGKLASQFSGWKIYYYHPVREAGLGLALLYLTVLVPTGVTWGFATHQVHLNISSPHSTHSNPRACLRPCWAE